MITITHYLFILGRILERLHQWTLWRKSGRTELVPILPNISSNHWPFGGGSYCICHMEMPVPKKTTWTIHVHTEQKQGRYRRQSHSWWEKSHPSGIQHSSFSPRRNVWRQWTVPSVPELHRETCGFPINPVVKPWTTTILWGSCWRTKHREKWVCKSFGSSSSVRGHCE